jgi:N-acetyl-gamma-glutamyl-phosphate reductase
VWYGEEHAHPELLDSFAYGLPELFRGDIAGATRVAAPGCYVTAAVLALAALLRAGLVEATGIGVDAASGVSGQPGAQAEHAFARWTRTWSPTVADHRHTGDRAGLGRVPAAPLLFTPHLAPINRHPATCYARRRLPQHRWGCRPAAQAWEGEPFAS